MNSIICIGPCSNPKRNYFTGQSVMFDGVVNHLNKHTLNTVVINIASRFSNKKNLSRVLDYVIIIIQLIFKLVVSNISIAYVTTSQSPRGFLRDYVLIAILQFFRIPVIAHQYGANYQQLLEALDKKGFDRLKRMLGYIDTIIVEGYYMKQQYSFMPNYENKVIVIPNGLPIEGKNVGKPKSYDDSKPFMLLYLSNMIWSKGYFDVLEAVDCLVNKERLNVKCVFAGQFMSSSDDEGPNMANKDDFIRFVNSHNLNTHIIYHSGLYGDEKDKIFEESNVFILPTYYINEGQPISIIEAMAYGCVPIVTDYRHIPVMVNENNGCFVEAKSPGMIANTVKYLMDNQDIYMSKSKQCIYDYQRQFTFTVFADKVVECINSIIS